METLSPILAFYTADGWQAGCERCIEVLHFGGIGHTLGLHASNTRVIEAFALEKPAMRIVVNTVAALGSVGYTNRLFPSMTLGPGTIGGSIPSDNVSPLHLLNVKRLAFETDPINTADAAPPPMDLSRYGNPPVRRTDAAPAASSAAPASWIEQIEARLRARAGNPSAPASAAASTPLPPGPTANPTADAKPATPQSSTLALPDEQIDRLIQQFKK